MKKLRLLLLSLFTPLLFGVSFGVSVWFSDNSYLLEQTDYWSLNSNNSSFRVYDISSPFCVSFYNAVSPNNYDSSIQVRGCWIDQNHGFEQCGIPLNSNNLYFTVWTNSTIICFDPTTLESGMPDYTLSALLFDWSFWNYSLTSVDYNVYSIGSYTPTNCSSIQSQLSSCQSDLSTMSWSYNTCLNTLNDRNWQIWTLSWSLASCNSSLSSCQSDLSACSNGCDTLINQCEENLWICQTNYSGCVITNASLQNYNDSLSSQLNECLSSWSWSISWSWFVFNSFDIFWSDGWNSYSLPITNNLFLPNGYKGVLSVDNVLSIARANSYSTALQITDSDFNNKVVWSYSVVFLFFMSSWLFLVFIYVIRKYFIWLKN